MSITTYGWGAGYAISTYGWGWQRVVAAIPLLTANCLFEAVDSALIDIGTPELRFKGSPSIRARGSITLRNKGIPELRDKGSPAIRKDSSEC